MSNHSPDNQDGPEKVRYKGIEITSRPAIDQPFNPDVTYYADARHLFNANDMDKAREVTFQAYGYSKEEAIRQIKMRIEEFLIDRKYDSA